MLKKKEFIEQLNSMIDDEMNITNLQSDDFNPEVLHTLWRVKEIALELDD